MVVVVVVVVAVVVVVVVNFKDKYLYKLYQKPAMLSGISILIYF